MNLINAAGSNDKTMFLEALKSALSDFYNKEPGTNLEKIYQVLANLLALTDRDVSALRNDNVLFATVADETVTRSEGDEDHLGQESVFQIARIGFTSTLFMRQEQHYIGDKDTIIYLQHVPLDFRYIRIYNTTGSTRTQVSQILSTDENNNSITVAGISVPGTYVFEYVDKGNVKEETEALQIPAEVFQIGFDEGGFGNYGFGE